MSSNHERILDQFTRQAVPFASASSIRNREALDRIVRMAEAGPTDTVLDVASGPGLLVCAFAKVVAHATGIADSRDAGAIAPRAAATRPGEHQLAAGRRVDSSLP